ncbi:MAG: prolipoprotein diacylglyceryl transferase, partial [Planctomycetes bacterium]|nr:prolipoprotein diacylglyceryl transferase [Planctomycetota bacterium]
MRRILFTVPIGNGIPVFGYGLFLMLGFIVALWIAVRRAKRAGLLRDNVIDIGLISIFAGVIGARLAFLLLDYAPADGSRFGNPLEWLAVWQGGLTFQGGLILAIIADWIYLRWKRISIGKMFDAYAPALAVGVGFGRIGCLLNGCCWGKPAQAWFPFGMIFPPDNESMAMQMSLHNYWPDNWRELMGQLGYPLDTHAPIGLYPTQLVSAIGLFLIAAGLVWAEWKWRNRADGQVIIWFIFAYAVGRFLIEFWRDDTPLRYGFGPFPGLRLGQWLALAMLHVGI